MNGGAGAARPGETTVDALGLVFPFGTLDVNTGVVGKPKATPGGEVEALKITLDA